jgi:hypothetical protein
MAHGVFAGEGVFGEEADGSAKHQLRGVCDPLNKFQVSAGWWVVKGMVWQGSSCQICCHSRMALQ